MSNKTTKRTTQGLAIAATIIGPIVTEQVIHELKYNPGDIELPPWYSLVCDVDVCKAVAFQIYHTTIDDVKTHPVVVNPAVTSLLRDVTDEELQFFYEVVGAHLRSALISYCESVCDLHS